MKKMEVHVACYNRESIKTISFCICGKKVALIKFSKSVFLKSTNFGIQIS